ncbi:hypothetical protein CBL_04232 [Carabus blaptoides fortunei]
MGYGGGKKCNLVSFRMQDRNIALIPATWNPVLFGKPGTNFTKIARQFKNISYCREPLSCVGDCEVKYTSFPYRTLMILVFMLWNDERVLKKPHWLNGIVASFLV